MARTNRTRIPAWVVVNNHTRDCVRLPVDDSLFLASPMYFFLPRPDERRQITSSARETHSRTVPSLKELGEAMVHKPCCRRTTNYRLHVCAPRPRAPRIFASCKHLTRYCAAIPTSITTLAFTPKYVIIYPAKLPV